MRDLDGHSRRNNRQYEVRLVGERGVIIDDLDTGALHPLDAGRAASLERSHHTRAAFAHPAGHRGAHLACANDGDAYCGRFAHILILRPLPAA